MSSRLNTHTAFLCDYYNIFHSACQLFGTILFGYKMTDEIPFDFSSAFSLIIAVQVLSRVFTLNIIVKVWRFAVQNNLWALLYQA